MIFGVGTDIVEIERIQQSIEKWGDKFLSRILTENEKSYCLNKSNAAESVAARFAAKEAFYKSLPDEWQPCTGWQDVEIQIKNGRPHIVYKGRFHKEMAARKIHLSLSHSRTAATAVVVIE